MQTPSVGRVLLFTPGASDLTLARVDSVQPMAAIVTYVWSEFMVNLTVFDHNGVSQSRTSVPLLAPGAEMPECGFFARWPAHAPAAKAEEKPPVALVSAEVAQLKLEPGDVLAVTVPERLTNDARRSIAQGVGNLFPDGVVVAVFDAGVKLTKLESGALNVEGDVTFVESGVQTPVPEEPSRIALLNP